MSADDADALAGLSLKERELLQYLEDLQRNNPAEYDMIAKQIQEGGANLGDTLGNGSKAGKKPPAPKGEMVTPEPGFVAKTHSFTHQARKTFVNLCKSDHVDPPAQVEVPGGKPDECQMRIPLSLGPPREDLDKEGDVCCVYDVVFHSETIEAALNDKDFRGFVLQLAAHQIKEKHGDELSEDFKFPKLANNYKGLAPLPQLMRRKGVSAAEAKATPASEGGGWDGEGSRKPMVEEVSEPEVPSTSLAAPTFVVEPTSWGRGAGGAAGEGGGEGGGDEQQPATECLAVRVHLPLVEYCDELQLQLGVEALALHAPGKYALSVSLPRAVAAEPLACTFETERRVLRVVLAAAAAPSAADGLSDASLPDASEQAAVPAAERERRDKERRARARAREQRAAAARGDKLPAADKGGAASTEPARGGATGEGATSALGDAEGAPAEPGESAAAAEAERAGDAAGDEPPTGGAPDEPGKLLLSNSIMWELEPAGAGMWVE